MIRLLKANLFRLKRDKLFLLGVCGMTFFGIFSSVMQYRSKMEFGYSVMVDEIFFTPMVVTGILIAAFCSMYLGTEYSDGTLRNKIAAGRGRADIYLSNFVTCTIAGWLMNLGYIVMVCAAGIPLLGFPQDDIGLILLFVLESALLIMSFSAIFTMLSMLNQNKTVVAIISIIGVVAAICIAIGLYSRLSEPEFWEYLSQNESGVMETIITSNPRYVNESKRAVYHFILNVLPTGQGMQIAGRIASNMGFRALSSALIIIISNAMGVFFFLKKDIK